MRILLAEDDLALGRALSEGLRKFGYAVDWVTDGLHAATALETPGHAAVVLDWNLPRRSGPDIIGGMRRRKDGRPALLLTARDELADRVAGLDVGADDYVVKPVHLDELAARLRALVRRAEGQSEPRVRLGGLEIDPAARRATLDGTTLDLTAREFALLELLARHPGRAHSRGQLEEALYGWGNEVASNAVEVHVHHLRNKLGPGWIDTLRGIGYAIRAPAGGDA